MCSRQQLIEFQESLGDQTNVLLLVLGNQLLSKEGKDNNVVFSPLSIQVVLSLATAGSKDRTRKQLLTFLKAKSRKKLNPLSSQLIDYVLVDGSSLGGPLLSLANGVWIDKSTPLNTSFKSVANTCYKATADEVDFKYQAEAARELVNSWVKKETRGLIGNIIPPKLFTSLTKLAIANAIYFKGVWKQKFSVSETKEHKFHLVDGHSVRVPFMTSSKNQFISVFDNFKVLRLPYEQGKDSRQFSMCIFLPDAKDGLPTLAHKVCSESGFVDNHIPYRKVRVGKFRIPKFKFEFKFEVSDALKEVGIDLPFHPKGGLTDIVESDKPLIVSDIIHKALIEVNEEGTKAAAATLLSAKLLCYRAPQKIILVDFVADHPFLFLVREDITGAVLFVGHLLNPKSSSA